MPFGREGIVTLDFSSAVEVRCALVENFGVADCDEGGEGAVLW